MCDKLFDKSKDNEKAADYLFNKKRHYSAIVHCAYYSCFQLILYLLKNYLYRNEASLRDESKNGKKSIHVTCIENIFNDLIEFNSECASDFNDYINELKEMRICSDYQNREIDSNYSLKAINLSRNIKKILKEKYNYAD